MPNGQRPIEETESALLDWMDETGSSMKQALDQFGVTDQALRNTILARNIERTTGMGPGASYQSAQTTEQLPTAPTSGFQPMMNPQEYGRYAITEARQEARARPGGVAKNLPVVAPAPQIQREAMQQEAETIGLPPEQATALAAAERPELFSTTTPEQPQMPGIRYFQPGQQMQMSVFKRGIPGGGGGRLGRMIGEYEKLGSALQQTGKEGAAAIGSALESQEEALRREKNLAQAQATQEAILSRERMQEYDRLQLEHQERESRRQAMVRRDMDALRDSIAQVRETKIDPTRFYKHPSGEQNYGKTILASVAIALGALGEGMMGRGGNPALNIIQAAIDRDIDAQKTDLANRRAGVGLEMNMLGQMRTQFADERQAEAAARLAMLDSYEMKLDQVAAQTKSEVVQRRYEKQKADLELLKAQQMNRFEQDSITNAMKATQTAFGMEATRQQLGLQRQAMQVKMAGEGAPPTLGDYVPFRKVNEDELGAAQRTIDKVGEAVEALDQLMAFRDVAGSEMWPAYVSKNTAKLQTMAQDLLLKMKDIYDMGALQQHELEMMREIIPDPTSWGNVMPQLEVLRDLSVRRLDSRMQLRGYIRKMPRALPGEQEEPRG